MVKNYITHDSVQKIPPIRELELAKLFSSAHFHEALWLNRIPVLSK